MSYIKNFKICCLMVVLSMVGGIALSGCALMSEYNQGNDALKKGNFDMALKHYNKHLEKNPNLNYPPAYNNRAVVWIKKYGFEKAIKDVEKAMELTNRIDRNIKRHYEIKGAALTFLKRYDEAIETYRNGIKNISHVKAIAGMPEPYYMKNELRQALKYHERLVGEYKSPKYVNPYYYLTIYYEMSDRRKFKKTFRRLMKERYQKDKPPLKAGMQLYRSIIEYEKGDQKKSREAAKKAVALDTKMPHFILDRAFNKYADLEANNPYPAEVYLYFSQAFESHDNQKLAYEMAYYAYRLEPKNSRYLDKFDQLKKTVVVDSFQYEHWPEIAADYIPL